MHMLVYSGSATKYDSEFDSLPLATKVVLSLVKAVNGIDALYVFDN